MQLIWEEFLKIIKEEAGTQVVETWFKAVFLKRWDPETKTVFLLMPNPFVKKWIQEHYSVLIRTHLGRLLHSDEVKLFLGCKTEEKNKDKKLIPASVLQRQAISAPRPEKTILPATYVKNEVIKKPLLYKKFLRIHQTRLNPGYNFDSFVVGPSNSLAHAASMAVSENPGRVYNPLFIYGKTGLGKTHLLHAIGNAIKKRDKSAIVLYVTSDAFMNEFINAIKLDRSKQFREKYHKANLLLLDDIQFFSNKELTQETFFHIFDNLHTQNKQVVFSSDTLPKEISGLQGRLRSRLQCGLVTDIQMPTLEMKMAILKKKAQLQSLDLSDEVARFISSQEVSSIRELEGYLIRLSAFSSLTNNEITLQMAEQVLSQQIQTSYKANSSLEKVIKAVSKHCDVSVIDLKSKKRSQDIALARQIAFYTMKKTTPYSFQAIGNFIGGRNHTTVLHAVAKLEVLKAESPEIAKRLQSIENSL